MAPIRQLELALQGGPGPELSSVIRTPQGSRNTVTRAQVPDEIRRGIERFKPRSVPFHDWQAVGDFVRGIVVDWEPASRPSAQSAMRVVGQLASYAIECHVPLDRESVLSPDFVGRFIHHLEASGRTSATVGTYHSLLRSVGPSVTVFAPWTQPTSHERTNTPPPYEPSVIAAYIRNASAQSTLLRQNQQLVIIGLGAGAGLRAEEIRAFAGRDLDHLGRVEIRSSRPRIVDVWPELLDALVYGIGGQKGRLFSDHKNALNDACRRLRLDPTLPRMHIRRLRNTWISNQLDRLTVAELLEASGLASVRVIDDLYRTRFVNGVSE